MTCERCTRAGEICEFVTTNKKRGPKPKTKEKQDVGEINAWIDESSDNHTENSIIEDANAENKNDEFPSSSSPKAHSPSPRKSDDVQCFDRESTDMDSEANDSGPDQTYQHWMVGADFYGFGLVPQVPQDTQFDSTYFDGFSYAL